ncbi:hypothetical protein J437_LFUL002770 [Ladona fulva]|uniref:BZIP domain-containing protein n=1 Tax=Ladona fulva TaxID=123851 RepID=A0A8K0JTJ8_LADFU|nr:hypothetical protein J437_LFUL002770 [Ladona fulva]
MEAVSAEPLDLTGLPPDYWYQQFVAFDGLNCGVPTRTTPTLTPTTLRNIEQTFIELQCEAEAATPRQNEAGFVPPVVQPIPREGSTYTNVDSKSWQGGSATVASIPRRASGVNPTVANTAVNNGSAGTPAPTGRRNVGGRRPLKDERLSPEEEERRRVRRERNKMAAARCRKRRMDHTNSLLIETEGLEQKKQGLQSEIQQLQMQKEELEFLLEAHKACCRLSAANGVPPSPPDVKPVIFNISKEDMGEEIHIDSRTLPTLPPPRSPTARNTRPSRPTTLSVAAAFAPAHHIMQGGGSAASEVAGIPITTPSSGIPFNFDSLMEGGTGLTPVSAASTAGMLVPSCSSQQRSSGTTMGVNVEMSSPDAVPPKLVSL